MHKFFSQLLLSLLLLLPSSFVFCAPEEINRLIILGDSLSDNGNDLAITQQLHKLTHTIPVVPTPEVYWNGRFSDGPVWADYLAGILGFMPIPFAPEQRASPQFQNFAYGGAWAELVQIDDPKLVQFDTHWHLFPPSLGTQIDDYLLRSRATNHSATQKILAHDLVMVWIGGNDYLNQEFKDSPEPRSPNQSTDEVIEVIRTGLDTMIQAGVSHFLFLGLPDLSKTPDIYLRDPHGQTLLPKLAATSLLHNKKLQQLVTDFAKKYPTTHFSYIDINQLFDEEYVAASERAEQYKLAHQGHFQKFSIPCILESNDPDPALIPFMRFNPILAMTAAPRFLVKSNAITKYRQCDLHEAYDQKSQYNFSEDYDAGGIFFDHVHPLTQLHAKIALAVCREVQLQQYRFLKPNTFTYKEIDCSQFSSMDLVRQITESAFPESTR